MHRSIVPVLLLAASAAGCAGVQHYEGPSPTHVVTVRVWVQKHQHLPAADILYGCELWKAKGIRCVQVADRQQSHIQVIPIDRPCMSSPDGSTTLAYASSGGEIAVMTDCFVNDKAVFATKQFRAVVGHEVGHELGIWHHVPEKCEKGVTICGPALMNPHNVPNIDFITPIDSLAFDARQTQDAVVEYTEGSTVVAPHDHDEFGCEYTTRPR